MIELQDYLVSWIKKKVAEADAQGAIIGISGGVDSAVVAALTKKALPTTSLGIIMPCHSDPKDAELARLLADAIDLSYKQIDLAPLFDQMLFLLKAEEDSNNRLAIANLKPRLRMTTLYYYAATMKSLVIGTGNKSEIMTGYFTKYGDGGVDIEPLGNLYKTQVFQLARHLNIPEQIIQRAPSAGLWSNQTDEEEMGITYRELDRYLFFGEGTAQTRELAEMLILNSKHKRKLPPIPDKQFPLTF